MSDPFGPAPAIAALALPSTPRSFNETRTAHWRAAQRAKLELQEAIAWTIRAGQGSGEIPRRARRVQASATIVFTQARRRDEDNFRTPLAKSLGDALTEIALIPDDTPEFFRLTALSMTTSRHRGGAALLRAHGLAGKGTVILLGLWPVHPAEQGSSPAIPHPPREEH